MNQHFSSKSWSECPSVCPVLFRFQQFSPKPNCMILGPNGIGVNPLELFICPCLGAALNLDMVAT